MELLGNLTAKKGVFDSSTQVKNGTGSVLLYLFSSQLNGSDVHPSCNSRKDNAGGILWLDRGVCHSAMAIVANGLVGQVWRDAF